MAKTVVAGDLYFDLDGQLLEIKRQLRQPNGYPFDSAKLKMHLQAAIVGCFVTAIGTFKHDRRNDGWILLENRSRRIRGPIVGVPFLNLNNDGESSVSGDVVAERAVTLGANYGQEDAEWLLEHQQQLQEKVIPEELQRCNLVFPATKWLNQGGGLIMPCLRLRTFQQWQLIFILLDDEFSGRDRLVRPQNK